MKTLAIVALLLIQAVSAQTCAEHTKQSMSIVFDSTVASSLYGDLYAIWRDSTGTRHCAGKQPINGTPVSLTVWLNDAYGDEPHSIPSGESLRIGFKDLEGHRNMLRIRYYTYTFDGDSLVYPIGRRWIPTTGHIGLIWIIRAEPTSQSFSIMEGNGVGEWPTISLPYPNPSDGIIWLPHATPYRLYDLLGRLVNKGTGSRIDLHSLPKGVYIIKYDRQTYLITLQ